MLSHTRAAFSREKSKRAAGRLTAGGFRTQSSQVCGPPPASARPAAHSSGGTGRSGTRPSVLWRPRPERASPPLHLFSCHSGFLLLSLKVSECGSISPKGAAAFAPAAPSEPRRHRTDTRGHGVTDCYLETFPVWCLAEVRL